MYTYTLLQYLHPKSVNARTQADCRYMPASASHSPYTLSVSAKLFRGDAYAQYLPARLAADPVG